MKFFVPIAKDDNKAEQIYSALANSVQAPITKQRIWQLQWRHNAIDMQAEVGKPLPPALTTGKELVLAIFDCENLYKICTLSRGGVKGEPIVVEKHVQLSVTYFTE